MSVRPIDPSRGGLLPSTAMQRSWPGPSPDAPRAQTRPTSLHRGTRAVPVASWLSVFSAWVAFTAVLAVPAPAQAQLIGPPDPVDAPRRWGLGAEARYRFMTGEATQLGPTHGYGFAADIRYFFLPWMGVQAIFSFDRFL